HCALWKQFAYQLHIAVNPQPLVQLVTGTPDFADILTGRRVEHSLEEKRQEPAGEFEGALLKLTGNLRRIPMDDTAKQFRIRPELLLLWKLIMGYALAAHFFPELGLIRRIYFPGVLLQADQLQVRHARDELADPVPMLVENMFQRQFVHCLDQSVPVLIESVDRPVPDIGNELGINFYGWFQVACCLVKIVFISRIRLRISSRPRRAILLVTT